MAINDYCTLAEVKAAIDPGMTTSYDTQLGDFITRASRMIDRFTGREPGAYCVTTDTTRYFNGDGTRALWVDELVTVTSLYVLESGNADTVSESGGNYTTWTTSDYLLWPYNAADKLQPYNRVEVNPSSTKVYFPPGYRTVKITGKFGYATTIPDDINIATVIEVSRMFRRGQQGFADTSTIQELSQVRYTKGLDPSTVTLLAPYKKVTL